MSKYLTLIVALIVILWFALITLLLYKTDSGWQYWLWIGGPFVAVRLVRCILIIKSLRS